MPKIDIIAGFLGFGKTTFANLYLNYLVESGIKTVYIVNEFGAVGLDAEIIEGNGFNSIEVVGGCVCCTLKADIANALKEVIKTYAPERIVFEPSGIFVFENFYEVFEDRDLKESCESGLELTIVDSSAFYKINALPGSFLHNQVKNAGVLVVSKLEKFEGDRDKLVEDIKAINAEALLIAKPFTELDNSDFARIVSQESRGRMTSSDEELEHVHMHSVTVSTADRNFDYLTFQLLVQKLKSDQYGDIARAKGYLKLNGEPRLFNFTKTDVNLSPAKEVSNYRITIIGEHIDEESIEATIFDN